MSIAISIVKSTAPSGATIYALSPDRISIGAQDANAVDQIQFADIPAEWTGMEIRAVFTPDSGSAAAIVLDSTGIITVPAAITQYRRGTLGLDATDGSYHAYTRGCDYVAYYHPPADGSTPVPSASEYEQLVARVEAAEAAVDTDAKAAAQSASDAAGSAKSAADTLADVNTAGDAKIAAINALDVYTKAAANARFAGALVATDSGNPLTIFPDSTTLPQALASVKVNGLTTQAGTGTPSPTNIRAITGVAASATVGGTAYSVSTGALFTGDTADLVSGAVHRALMAFVVDGTTIKFSLKSGGFWNLPNGSAPGVGNYAAYTGKIVSSHFYAKFASNQAGAFCYTTSTNMSGIFGTVDELNTYRAAQYAAGTPVQVLYQLATPTDTAGTGNAITVSGDTTVTAENTVAVTYNKSLAAAISQLAAAIAAK